MKRNTSIWKALKSREYDFSLVYFEYFAFNLINSYRSPNMFKALFWKDVWKLRRLG